MTPTTIPFSSIDLGTRGRTQYRGIDELAESIEHNGLVQPIVLTQQNEVDFETRQPLPQFLLLAGGRRYHALLQLGVTELHHGVSSVPGRYGFVLKDEASSPLTNLLTELAENLDRDDIDWRDNCHMIVRAAKLLRQQAHSNGHMILMRDLGSIIGCGYNDLRVAELIHNDLVANPGDYKDVTGLRAAAQVMAKKEAKFLEGLIVENSFKSNPAQVVPSRKEGDSTAPTIRAEQALAGPAIGDTNVPPVVIPLTQRFLNTNGIEWLKGCRADFDHIICDPDFAVSKDRLAARNWSPDSSSAGVAQVDVETSLSDLQRFITSAFTALRDKGFLIFFYDLDHHEKLQAFAEDAGFRVQRWPFIWYKTDARANASPQSNFTKVFEYAMVCRKPGSVLAQSPQPSFFACPSGPTTKEFGHPFAKPKLLWDFLFNAVCIKGQRVFDPFVGSGSSALAGIEWGLDFSGTEVQEQYHNTLLLNLQRYYKKAVGENARFE